MQQKYLSSRAGSSSGGDFGPQTSVISTHEHKRKRGEAMLVERLVFFEGMVYQIEEEIYSESDHSSVYTSEDSFEEDDTLQRKYKKYSPLLSAYDAESNNLNATMTSIGFTVAGRKNLDKIEGYPAPETPDESKSRSDITAKQMNISDDASEDKSENN